MLICPNCNQQVVEVIDVRGRKACARCQLDYVWDFIEGTRRIIRGDEVDKEKIPNIPRF